MNYQYLGFPTRHNQSVQKVQFLETVKVRVKEKCPKEEQRQDRENK